MKLYEIAADYQRLLDAIDNGEIPEDAIVDTLESITSVLEDKADNIACIIKALTAEAEAIKAEEDKLAERRKRKLKRAERLTEYLSECLTNAGCNKIETARNVISFRKTPGKVVIDNEDAFIMYCYGNNPDLLKVSTTVDRTAVKAAIAAGAQFEGVRIESRQNIAIK